jgi:hypothetical protein
MERAVRAGEQRARDELRQTRRPRVALRCAALLLILRSGALRSVALLFFDFA